VGDLLIYGDTVRSPELRHEVPVPVPDPFLYIERNGLRYAFVGSLEIPRMQGLDGLQAVPLDELGMDDLIAQGLRTADLDRELVLRACRRVGIEEAVAPRTFPLFVADHLRANGVQVQADGDVFEQRRRVKSESELAGIRRAQKAAEGAMDAIRTGLRGGDVSSE
jgi:Xaa-Pro aminopeptidase